MSQVDIRDANRTVTECQTMVPVIKTHKLQYYIFK